MRQSKGILALICAVWMSLISSLFVITTTAKAETTVTVHKGDTLWAIAVQHHTSVGQLEHTNHLTSDILQIHQRLVIPPEHSTSFHPIPKTRYLVKRGNSLWAISVQYGVTVRQLQTWNHLHSSVIYPGETLWIHTSRAPWHESRTPKSTRHRQLNTVHRGIPLRFISVYQQAGKHYGIPWTVLAAIHHIETNFGTTPEISVDGAEGPMQFMPSTFAEYAVTAPGHPGPPNINNVYDAIWTCAHMLAADGYRTNPTGALYLYNHSMFYVSDVRRLANQYAA